MHVKISLFSFLAALIWVSSKILQERTDSNGNIYIRTPKEIWNSTKAGWEKFKEYIKKREGR